MLMQQRNGELREVRIRTFASCSAFLASSSSVYSCSRSQTPLRRPHIVHCANWETSVSPVPLLRCARSILSSERRSPASEDNATDTKWRNAQCSYTLVEHGARKTRACRSAGA